jgi:hypothetical protein
VRDRWFVAMMISLSVLTVAMVIGALFWPEIDKQAHVDMYQSSRVR